MPTNYLLDSDVLAATLRQRGYTVTPPAEQRTLAEMPAINYVRLHKIGLRAVHAVETSRSDANYVRHIETVDDLAEAVATKEILSLSNMGVKTLEKLRRALEADGLL